MICFYRENLSLVRQIEELEELYILSPVTQVSCDLDRKIAKIYRDLAKLQNIPSPFFSLYLRFLMHMIDTWKAQAPPSFLVRRWYWSDATTYWNQRYATLKTQQERIGQLIARDPIGNAVLSLDHHMIVSIEEKWRPLLLTVMEDASLYDMWFTTQDLILKQYIREAMHHCDLSNHVYACIDLLVNQSLREECVRDFIACEQGLCQQKEIYIAQSKSSVTLSKKVAIVFQGVLRYESRKRLLYALAKRVCAHREGSKQERFHFIQRAFLFFRDAFCPDREPLFSSLQAYFIEEDRRAWAAFNSLAEEQSAINNRSTRKVRPLQ